MQLGTCAARHLCISIAFHSSRTPHFLQPRLHSSGIRKTGTEVTSEASRKLCKEGLCWKGHFHLLIPCLFPEGFRNNPTATKESTTVQSWQRRKVEGRNYSPRCSCLQKHLLGAGHLKIIQQKQKRPFRVHCHFSMRTKSLENPQTGFIIPTFYSQSCLFNPGLPS